MKRVFLLSSAIVLLSSVACRQEDELLSNQDITNLKIIQETRNLKENNNSNNSNQMILRKDTIIINNIKISGEQTPPPKK